ncbi:MAG: porin [Gammaproteobacteria bacterium]|nr:porin [Gammaproteobacteria bacterium]
MKHEKHIPGRGMSSRTAAGLLFASLIVSPHAYSEGEYSLEKRVEQLEKELEQQKEIKHSASPDFLDPDGDFWFGFRGRAQVDAAFFNASDGGRDFNSGTQVRRARLGFEGGLYKHWKWRVEADFASGSDAFLQDAYLQYSGFDNVSIKFGQALTPTNLETLTSSRFITFMERGSVINAFDRFRVIGLQASHAQKHYTIAGGVFGDAASVGASNADATGRHNDEGWSYHGRLTAAPVNESDRVIHLGLAGYRYTNPPNDQVRFGDRPEMRVDNARVVNTGTIGNVDSYNFYGFEAAGVYGPFSIQGQYGQVDVSRNSGNQDVNFDGYYIYGSYFLTGESRPYSKGTFSRVKPNSKFNLDGGTGAWEIAVRYSNLDLNDGPIMGGEMKNTTVGLNWYFNPYARMMLNWVSYDAEDSPIAVAGNNIEGDVIGTRVEVRLVIPIGSNNC